MSTPWIRNLLCAPHALAKTVGLSAKLRQNHSSAMRQASVFLCMDVSSLPSLQAAVIIEGNQYAKVCYMYKKTLVRLMMPRIPKNLDVVSWWHTGPEGFHSRYHKKQIWQTGESQAGRWPRQGASKCLRVDGHFLNPKHNPCQVGPVCRFWLANVDWCKNLI